MISTKLTYEIPMNKQKLPWIYDHYLKLNQKYPFYDFAYTYVLKILKRKVKYTRLFIFFFIYSSSNFSLTNL